MTAVVQIQLHFVFCGMCSGKCITNGQIAILSQPFNMDDCFSNKIYISFHIVFFCSLPAYNSVSSVIIVK